METTKQLPDLYDVHDHNTIDVSAMAEDVGFVDPVRISYRAWNAITAASSNFTMPGTIEGALRTALNVARVAARTDYTSGTVAFMFGFGDRPPANLRLSAYTLPDDTYFLVIDCDKHKE